MSVKTIKYVDIDKNRSYFLLGTAEAIRGAMRDGIWKRLPLPREWRSVLRSCVREAERGDVAAGKLTHALAKTLVGISPAFLRRLQLRAEEGPALPGLADVAALQGVTVLDGWVAARFVRLEAEGWRGDSLLQQAMVEAALQLREAYGRQIRQHCYCEAGEEAGAAVAALAAAEATVDLGALVVARIAGERPPRAMPRRPLSLDEDLTRSL